MKRGIIQTFLVIAISLFIPIFPAYLHYCNLAEADLLSLDLCIENPDQENLLIDQQNESKVFISSSFCIIFASGINFLEQLFRFPFTKYFLDQKTSVLRC
jgi:hypothetical protein